MRRILAFVMALILTFSTFGSASITGYAAPTDGVEVETVTVTEEGTEESSADVAGEEDVIIVETIEETTTAVVEELSTEITSEEETIEEMTMGVILPEVNSMSVNALTGEEVDYLALGYLSQSSEPYSLRISDTDILNNQLEVNDTIIINILNAYAEAYPSMINQVDLVYDMSDVKSAKTISMEVWNAVYDLTKDASTSVYKSAFSIHINDKAANGEYITWRFWDLLETNKNISLNMEIVPGGVGEGLTVTFDDTDMPIVSDDEIQIELTKYDTGEGYTLFREAILAMANETTGSFYDSEGNSISGPWFRVLDSEWNVELRMRGIIKLEADTPYTIKFPYSGILNEFNDNGYIKRELVLHPSYLGKDVFTSDEVAEIMSNHDKASLDSITIVTATENTSGSIKADVVNAALPYLKASTNDRKSSINISFMNSITQSGAAWVLENPQEQKADQTLTCSLSIVDDTALFSVGEHSLKADNININFYRNNGFDSDGVAVWKSMFGETDTELKIGSTNVYARYIPGTMNTNIFICNIQLLTPNTSYSVKKHIFKGNVYTWDDGRKELSIRYEEAPSGNTALSEDELLSILDNYKTTDELYCIYIEQPSSENNIIYKKVADKAASLLDGGILKFAFRDTATGSTMEWQLEDISAGVTQTADQKVSAYFSITEDNQLVFNRDSFELNVNEENGCVSIGYYINTENDFELAQGILKSLGIEEGYRLISTMENEAGGEINYNKNENNIWIYLHGIDVLEVGKEYPIINWAYHGDVETYPENDTIVTSLWLSSFRIEQNTFDLETLNQIVDYWVNQRGIRFDRVAIEQKYTSNNVIKKELINAAISLLSNPSEQTLEFVFCNCQGEEYNDEGELVKEFIQSDMNWTLYGPRTATKDINANVSVTGKGGGGVSVVLNSNTYPAEDTHVNFWMQETADIAQRKLIPALGRPQNESNLVVLKKAATLSDVYASYTNGEQEGYVSLHLSCVEDWTAGIDNRLVEAYYMSGINIGESFRLPLLAYDPADPDFVVVEPKNNIKFSVLTPEFATIANYDYLTATKPWEMVYVLCTYTGTNDKPCIQVLGYPTGVAINGLSFVEDTINIEWDGKNEAEGFLEIVTSPVAAKNYINPQDYSWEIEDGNSIKLREYDYYVWNEEDQREEVEGTRPNGEFIVTGYGTSVIRVSYNGLEPITCTVNVVGPVEVPEIPSIYAIPAVDTKLSDLGDLDTLIRARLENSDTAYEGSFAWKDASISLAPYKNMDWVEFGAVYTAKDGREVPVNVAVEMLHVEEIALRSATVCLTGNNDEETGEPIKDIKEYPLDNTTVQIGDELVIGYQVNINKPQFVYNKFTNQHDLTDAFKTYARYIAEGKIIFQWKENIPELPEDYEDREVYFNGRVQKPRLFTAEQKGKKIFTVQAVNLLTKEVFFESSATVYVNVKPLFTFDDNIDVNFKFTDSVDQENNMKGTYIFQIGEDNYANAKKLTFKSGDTSVLKLGSAKVADPIDGVVEITVPYEFKKFGKTVLKVTSADELKSSNAYSVERVDYAPKVSNINYTIDKSWFYSGEGETKTYRSTSIINFAFQHDTTPAGEAKIVGEDSQTIFRLNGDVDAAQYWIELVDVGNTKNKTYTVKLKVPYTINDDENVYYSEQTVKVKVTQSKVKVTAGQTKKINEFFTWNSEENVGIITLKAPYQIDGWWINDSVFELAEPDGNGYSQWDSALVLKDEFEAIETLSVTQKKIVVGYRLNGNEAGVYHEGTVNLTLKTEKKAPTLVIPKKSDTLYPNMGISGSGFDIINKATGESIELNERVSLSLVTDKKKNIAEAIFDVPELEYVVGKNTYLIYNDNWNICYMLSDETSAKKATDKFVIRVQKDNWKGYVDVNYSAIVNLKVPSLKLGKSTLTVNANDEVYRYQSDSTTLNVNGYNNSWFDQVWFTGTNQAAVDALKNNLLISWNPDESNIRVSILNKGREADDTLLKNGSYKYKVYTTLNGQKFSTNLTIKIVDKTIAKSVKVTKKGSIDVLRRGATQITLNPKLSNLTGFVQGFELAGPDATLFDSYYDGDTGNCVVHAKDGCVYSTKVTYNITPVYYIESNNGQYKVTGSAQKIKVTQGKPKVSVWSNTATLYGDKSIGALLGFDAALSNDYIAIRSVELLNYTNDLDWQWQPLYDYENDNFAEEYDENTESIEPLWGIGRLTLNGNTPKDITKASGKYTLKFAITYEDAAGNEKAATVSYKLNIVR